MKGKILAVGIIILFLITTITPTILGYDVKSIRFEFTEFSDIESDGPPMDSPWPMKSHDARHTGRSQYSTADNPGDEKWRFKTSYLNEKVGPVIDNNGTIYFGSNNGLYAMYPNGTLKWKYNVKLISVPAIAADGTIYISVGRSGLHAIYPNGTRKWKFSVEGNTTSSPVIAEDGTIYFKSQNQKLYAVNPDGTERWNYSTGHLGSSPAIGNDGTIYICSYTGYLYALYPNSTLRWCFKLEGKYIGIWGDPSIAEDGTIYIGSISRSHGEQRFYALYPNGTMKWKFNPHDDIWSSASIGKDGTIYLGSCDYYLYALYPNGTKKWDFYMGGRIIDSAPAIGDDGTIYIGTSSGQWDYGDLIAINPDGTEKWRKLISNRYIEASLAIGEDGTVYVASSSQSQYEDFYGYFHAFGIGKLKVDANGSYRELINVPIQFTGDTWNGTEPYTWHWDFGDGTTSEEQNPVHTYTAPCDCTDYYVVTLNVTDATGNKSGDITRARIAEKFYPPEDPYIEGPTSGKAGMVYNYTFFTWDYERDDVYYYIDWGDGTNTSWIGPYKSGEVIIESHSWYWGEYVIEVKAKDIYDYESDWSYLWVTMPRNRIVTNQWYLWFFERFPILERLLGLIRAG